MSPQWWTRYGGSTGCNFIRKLFTRTLVKQYCAILYLAYVGQRQTGMFRNAYRWLRNRFGALRETATCSSSSAAASTPPLLTRCACARSAPNACAAFMWTPA